jgi:NADH:ubiquinone oxidoreductase subunit 6 (subunit J)
MLLLLFHLILYAGSIFLLLFILFINKNIKNNFEENKLYHIYYFFGGVLFIMNTVLIIITFSNFLDKNNKDIYDYFIDIKDINEQNKIDKNSEYFYSLLYKYYRCFYNSQIRYLIGKKQEHMYI